MVSSNYDFARFGFLLVSVFDQVEIGNNNTTDIPASDFNFSGFPFEVFSGCKNSIVIINILNQNKLTWGCFNRCIVSEAGAATITHTALTIIDKNRVIYWVALPEAMLTQLIRLTITMFLFTELITGR
jgi:hypothetical protein